MVVGNGESINIWRDKWIGSKPATSIPKTQFVSHHYQSLIASLSKVKDLIDESGREWKKDILEIVFPEEERRQIQELRPGGKGTRDNYSWDYTKTGVYTVKSGYWVQTNIINQRGRPQECSQPSLNPIFQMIWQGRTSPKVHHFLWRCLSNCLPVAGNLAYRHISRNAYCPRCPSSIETVNHLLFKCTFARLLWAMSPIPAPPDGEWSDSLYPNMYWVLNLAREQPQMAKQALQVPWILWRIWKNRNELCFKDKEYNAEELLKRIAEDTEEWQTREQHTTSERAPRTAPSAPARWRPPPQQWVKCNFDATWRTEGHLCGLGWALRDEKGQILWMGARTLPKVKTVLEAELEALRWAVTIMYQFRYNKVIFESDSQNIITLLNSDENWPSLNPTLQDIRGMLYHFEEVKIKFIPRGANTVADRITREAISFSNYDPKLYSMVPNWVKNYVDVERVM